MFRPYLRPAILTACTLLGGCGGTQSQAAFVPRHAATVVRFVATPNVSGDHEQSLEAALDRSVREQELVDEREDMLAPVQAPCTFACGLLTDAHASPGQDELSSGATTKSDEASADGRSPTDERSAKEAPAQKDSPAEARAPAVRDDEPGVAGLEP
jgi:hypothetical protein